MVQATRHINLPLLAVPCVHWPMECARNCLVFLYLPRYVRTYKLPLLQLFTCPPARLLPFLTSGRQSRSCL